LLWPFILSQSIILQEVQSQPVALEVLEIETESPAGKEEAGRGKPDFSVRLREVESLRKEGLLTEEEYQRKRKEILDEKW